MPTRKAKPRPKHDHEWYAISFDPATRKPTLWACAAYWWCIATATRQWKGRGKKRALTDPEPIVPAPTRGMWGITDDEPQEVSP